MGQNAHRWSSKTFYMHLTWCSPSSQSHNWTRQDSWLFLRMDSAPLAHPHLSERSLLVLPTPMVYTESLGWLCLMHLSPASMPMLLVPSCQWTNSIRSLHTSPTTPYVVWSNQEPLKASISILTHHSHFVKCVSTWRSLEYLFPKNPKLMPRRMEREFILTCGDQHQSSPSVTRTIA